jgi:hypothetical protein
MLVFLNTTCELTAMPGCGVPDACGTLNSSEKSLVFPKPPLWPTELSVVLPPPRIVF